MNKNGDTIVIIQSLLGRVKSLETHNHDMSLRLDMFDEVMSALHGKPAEKTHTMMHPCPVHQAEEFLYKLKGN